MNDRYSGRRLGRHDVDILAHILRAHKGGGAGEDAVFLSATQVRVFHIPAVYGLKEHTLEPQGLLGEVLNMHLEEDFVSLRCRQLR